VTLVKGPVHTRAQRHSATHDKIGMRPLRLYALTQTVDKRGSAPYVLSHTRQKSENVSEVRLRSLASDACGFGSSSPHPANRPAPTPIYCMYMYYTKSSMFTPGRLTALRSSSRSPKTSSGSQRGTSTCASTRSAMFCSGATHCAAPVGRSGGGGEEPLHVRAEVGVAVRDAHGHGRHVGMVARHIDLERGRAEQRRAVAPHLADLVELRLRLRLTG